MYQPTTNHVIHCLTQDDRHDLNKNEVEAYFCVRLRLDDSLPPSDFSYENTIFRYEYSIIFAEREGTTIC